MSLRQSRFVPSPPADAFEILRGEIRGAGEWVIPALIATLMVALGYPNRFPPGSGLHREGRPVFDGPGIPELDQAAGAKQNRRHDGIEGQPAREIRVGEESGARNSEAQNSGRGQVSATEADVGGTPEPVGQAKAEAQEGGHHQPAHSRSSQHGYTAGYRAEQE